MAKDYHYWAYTDLDVLIGNLPQKIESMLDSDPDVVTASLSLFVAHFTLLKNNNRCRLLYQECDDWRRIFLTDDCEIFDEKNFGRHIAHLSATGEIKVERKQIVEENLRYFWSGRPRYIILWYHGRLLAPLSLRQPGYFHFINTRYKPEFRVETDPDADAFYITNKGIYPHPRTHRLPAIRSSFLLHRIDYHSMVREADSEVSAAQPAHISAKKTRAWKCCLTAATSFQMQQCPSTGSIGWDFLFG